jgi:hypothetical protein
MKITIQEHTLIIEECYDGVGIRTQDGKTLYVCLRDKGYDIRIVEPDQDPKTVKWHHVVTILDDLTKPEVTIHRADMPENFHCMPDPPRELKEKIEEAVSLDDRDIHEINEAQPTEIRNCENNQDIDAIFCPIIGNCNLSTSCQARYSRDYKNSLEADDHKDEIHSSSAEDLTDRLSRRMQIKAFIQEAADNGMSVTELIEIKTMAGEVSFSIDEVEAYNRDMAATDPEEGLRKMKERMEADKVIHAATDQTEIEAIVATMPPEHKKLYQDILSGSTLFISAGMAKMLLRQGLQYGPICQPYIDAYNKSLKKPVEVITVQGQNVEATVEEAKPEAPVTEEPLPEDRVEEYIQSSGMIEDTNEYLAEKAGEAPPIMEEPKQPVKKAPF